MSSSNKDVISGFYNKGSKIIPIGPDLRYIGKLPTSHNHNFEEEYLLGEDKKIKRWYGVDSDNQPCYREEIRYGSAEDGYYWLDYFEYDMRPMNQDVTYNNEVLTIDVHSKFNLPNVEGTVLRKYNLYYHKNGQDELFSSKIVESRFIQDNNDPSRRKQIEIIKHSSAPVPPSPMPDNVLFDGGRFNPIHLPQGFDFNNNRQVVVVNSDYDVFENACTNAFEDGDYASHYNDGSTFLIKTDNSANETILLDPVSGCIVFEYPTKRMAPSWEERVVYQSIVIPVVGFDSDVHHVYIRLKSTSAKMPEGYVIMFTMEKLSSTSVYGDDFYIWGHEDGFYNQWGEIYCMAGYTDNKMDYLQIWFEARLQNEWEDGDDPFKVEIDKILII